MTRLSSLNVNVLQHQAQHFVEGLNVLPTFHKFSQLISEAGFAQHHLGSQAQLFGIAAMAKDDSGPRHSSTLADFPADNNPQADQHDDYLAGAEKNPTDQCHLVLSKSPRVEVSRPLCWSKRKSP